MISKINEGNITENKKTAGNKSNDTITYAVQAILVLCVDNPYESRTITLCSVN